MRSNSRLILIFSDNLYLRFEPSRLRYIRPDEQSNFGIIKRVIIKASLSKLTKPREFSPGIFVGNGELIDFLKGGEEIFYHDMRGMNLLDVKLPSQFKLVLGFPSLSNNDKKVLKKINAKAIKISSSYLYPQYLILILHNHCDKLSRGYK